MISWSGGGFHLTVNVEGVVSLWDSKEVAMEIFGEKYLFLPLTKEQIVVLMGAATAAKELKEGNGF